jgi:hypothetical protein
MRQSTRGEQALKGGAMVRRLKCTCGVVLALLAADALPATVVGIPQPEFRRVYPLISTGRVIVQNLYGDVRIMAWDREQVQVQAIRKAKDPRRLDEARIIVDSTYDSFTISTQYPSSDVDRPASIEYRIMVPRNANLEQVKLINGALFIGGVAGPVRASSVNGSIHVEGLEGEAELSTVNGQLIAGFNRLGSETPISLSSINGPIRLAIPAGSSPNIEARNLSGGIDSDIGQTWRASGGHRMQASGRKGGALIRVHNVNGGIQIRSNVVSRSWS